MLRPLCCAFVCALFAQAASAAPGTAGPRAKPAPERATPYAVEGATLITFSEFPIGTPISDQYGDQGILFGGDSPFIATDGANPTSPVLSGTPQYFGAIEGYFVDPSDGVTPTTVESVTLDAGYFDQVGSTAVTAYDRNGNVVDRVTNFDLGIVSLTLSSKRGIASWRIEPIGQEDAGYAIDNVSFGPGTETLSLCVYRGDDAEAGRNTAKIDGEGGLEEQVTDGDGCVEYPGVGEAYLITVNGTNQSR